MSKYISSSCHIIRVRLGGHYATLATTSSRCILTGNVSSQSFFLPRDRYVVPDNNPHRKSS